MVNSGNMGVSSSENGGTPKWLVGLEDIRRQNPTRMDGFLGNVLQKMDGFLGETPRKPPLINGICHDKIDPPRFVE